MAAVIRAMDADLVALQEVDGTPGRGADSMQMIELAQAGDYRAIAGPTILGPGRHYGNALLTRLPVEDVQRLDLSLPGREPRAAILAHLRTPAGARLRCLVTHLGLAGRERGRSCACCCRPSTRRTGRCWSWVISTPGPAMAPQDAALAPASPGPTGELSGHPPPARPRPDRVHPPGLLIALASVRSPATRAASDHIPVLARLRDPGSNQVSPAVGNP